MRSVYVFFVALCILSCGAKENTEVEGLRDVPTGKEHLKLKVPNEYQELSFYQYSDLLMADSIDADEGLMINYARNDLETFFFIDSTNIDNRMVVILNGARESNEEPIDSYLSNIIYSLEVEWATTDVNLNILEKKYWENDNGVLLLKIRFKLLNANGYLRYVTYYEMVKEGMAGTFTVINTKNYDGSELLEYIWF